MTDHLPETVIAPTKAHRAPRAVVEVDDDITANHRITVFLSDGNQGVEACFSAEEARELAAGLIAAADAVDSPASATTVQSATTSTTKTTRA